MPSRKYARHNLILPPTTTRYTMSTRNGTTSRRSSRNTRNRRSHNKRPINSRLRRQLLPHRQMTRAQYHTSSHYLTGTMYPSRRSTTRRRPMLLRGKLVRSRPGTIRLGNLINTSLTTNRTHSIHKRRTRRRRSHRTRR